MAVFVQSVVIICFKFLFVHGLGPTATLIVDLNKPILAAFIRRLVRHPEKQNYSMFHVTWITFEFNKNQLGTVSAYAM